MNTNEGRYKDFIQKTDNPHARGAVLNITEGIGSKKVNSV